MTTLMPFRMVMAAIPGIFNRPSQISFSNLLNIARATPVNSDPMTTQDIQCSGAHIPGQHHGYTLLLEYRSNIAFTAAPTG